MISPSETNSPLKDWVFGIWDRFTLWCLVSGIVGEVEGVRLVDANNDQRDNEDFLAMTTEAVQLIKSTDPRRFAMLKREVHYIVNSCLNSGARYIRRHRQCHVDVGRYWFNRETESYSWHLVRYA